MRYLFFTYQSDVLCQTEQLQRADAIPVEVDFVPRQAVFGSARMRVMIVVPAFAKGKQRHPPAIGRIVASQEASRAPDMSRGIYQPGEVQSDRDSQKHANKQERPTAQREKSNAS